MDEHFTPTGLPLVKDGKGLFEKVLGRFTEKGEAGFDMYKTKQLRQFREENPHLSVIEETLTPLIGPSLIQIAMHNRVPQELQAELTYSSGWNDCYKFLREQSKQPGTEYTADNIPVVEANLFSEVSKHETSETFGQDKCVAQRKISDKENPQLLLIQLMMRRAKAVPLFEMCLERTSPPEAGQIMYETGWDDLYIFLSEQGALIPAGEKPEQIFN